MGVLVEGLKSSSSLIFMTLSLPALSSESETRIKRNLVKPQK